MPPPTVWAGGTHPYFTGGAVAAAVSMTSFTVPCMSTIEACTRSGYVGGLVLV